MNEAVRVFFFLTCVALLVLFLFPTIARWSAAAALICFCGMVVTAFMAGRH